MKKTKETIAMPASADRQRRSEFVQTGYHCQNCGWDTIIYNEHASIIGIIPNPQCQNCQSMQTKRKWKQKITQITFVEDLK